MTNEPRAFTTKDTKNTKAFWFFPMIFVCFVLFVANALSQTPPPASFRAGTDLVEVDISVLDKDRHPVRGLTADDFQVFEDGKLRRVTAFTAVDVPPSIQPTGATAAWTRDAISDVTTNALPEEGRLIVILIDRTIPDGFPTMAARDIAKNAVKEMGPNDVAAVVYSGGDGVPQNFTNDRARLIAAIDGSYAAAELSESANEHFGNLVSSLAQPMANSGMGALNFSTECFCGACVLQTIGRIADAVREVGRRRKSLLFIGHDLQIETVDSICIDPLRKAREQMFRALDISSLTVHALDPGGLEILAPGASSSRIPSYSGRGQANLIRQNNISVLPDRTGGQVIKNSNNPAAKVADIIHESDSYYLLGFVPGAAPDGKRHDIRVKVDRRDVDVRTRRAYMAAEPVTARAEPPAPSATTAREGEALARRSIEGLLPKRDNVVVSANITTLAQSETRAAVVALALDVHHAATGAIPRALVPPAEQVDVVTQVLTLNGGSVGQFKETLSIKPRPGAEGVSYEIVQRLPIKPGQYEIRTGIYNEARRQTGSVYAFVTVPNYEKEMFALTDVLVHSPEGFVSGAATIADVAGAAPTARRAFYRGETPVAIVRIFQGKGPAAVPLTISARIVDASNRRVFGQETTMPTAAFTRTGVADYQLSLPISGFEAGQYLLTIDARSPLGTAQKQLRFSVR